MKKIIIIPLSLLEILFLGDISTPGEDGFVALPLPACVWWVDGGRVNDGRGWMSFCGEEERAGQRGGYVHRIGYSFSATTTAYVNANVAHMRMSPSTYTTTRQGKSQAGPTHTHNPCM